MNNNKFKVVLLGEGRVGKTSILMRYTRNEFNDNQVCTIHAMYLDKVMKIGTRDVVLSIWDTAGQERFHALGPIYYRDADGALLVYDITDAQSFEKVRTWIKELRKIVGPNISIAIAGNKSDLEKHRVVGLQDAKDYAESVGATHILTSAKTDKNLSEIFSKLGERMLKQRTEKEAKQPRISTQNRIVISDDPPPPQIIKKKCC